MSDFRFIHAADIHLDSPLTGLARYDGAPAERLRRATREALSNLIDQAIEEQVDFMLVAGDLFDGQWRDMGTGLHFAREMGRLARHEIRVFVLKGNHDADSKITREIPWPTNVSVFGTRKPETFQIDKLRVALHGQSFRVAQTTENLVPNYPSPVPGAFNIGVLHTALEGYAAHASYAPCTMAELQARGYDYWALGHVHEFQILGESPTIVFPGNLQGRHIRETGDKGAVLVSVSDGQVACERLIVDVARWHRLAIDVGEDIDVAAVIRRVRKSLSEQFDQPDGRLHAVRIELTGRSAAHGPLAAASSSLRDQMLALAAGLAHDAVWIEKVRVLTQPPSSLNDIRARQDTLAEFADFYANLNQDAEELAGLRSDLERLLGMAGDDVAALSPELQLIADNRFDELLAQITPDLLARLQGSNA